MTLVIPALGGLAGQASIRRTFAIISHPDAGKTSFTEKFLLYAGAVAEAGAVKARTGRRRATSDWMAMEQQRGFSFPSTALQFTYRQHVVNLLDTPGHRNFSEDTYRVLAAADAVMVLDVAKSIKAQTLKLFEVGQAQNIPILTFLNKYDRPGRNPLELLDEIEARIELRPTPVTCPAGIAGGSPGGHRPSDGRLRPLHQDARGATAPPEEGIDAGRAAEEKGPTWGAALEECSLPDEMGANVNARSFLAGKTSPLFVRSALTNFGVRHFRDAVMDTAPPPSPRRDSVGVVRRLDAPFPGFEFKVQANMEPVPALAPSVCIPVTDVGFEPEGSHSSLCRRRLLPVHFARPCVA